MKSRILSIVLALSLLATMYVAFPAKAAYSYTGSVVTTDDTGNAKYVYIQGEDVYVNVNLLYQGEPVAENIRVRLIPAGFVVTDQFTALANDPAVGWYNSSQAGTVRTLSTTGFSIDQERVCYVIAYHQPTMTELDRTTILVRQAGFFVKPDPVYLSGWAYVGYYPGQTLDITMITDVTTEMFYVQIVNETGTTVQNWTGQIAPNGYWHATWQIPANLEDGTYVIRVRDSTTHVLWDVGVYSYNFDVRAYIFAAVPERENYLPGETAKIEIVTIDIATLGPATGVTVRYWAHWWNESNGDQWLNGTLATSMGKHEFAIPGTDIATWYGVEITYWANQSTRSQQDYIWLDLNLLKANIEVNWWYFLPGDPVAVTVWATIDGEPLPGCNVDVKVSKNGTAIAGYGATGLVTGPDGSVSYVFKLLANAEIGTYTVEATVSKVGFSTVAATNFYVEEWGTMNTHFNKDYYISGETMVLTFEAYWSGKQVALDKVFLIVVTDWGLLWIGNVTAMPVSIQLPTNYVGRVDAYATGYYGDKVLSSYGWTEVIAAELVMIVDKDTYLPGDKLTFTWNIVGPISSGTLYYQIWGGNIQMEVGSPVFAKTGKLTVQVPDNDPEVYYGVWMSLITSDGTYLETDVSSYLAPDGRIQIWAEKSKYADGSFAPGQTVKIGYEIFSFWNDPLPLYMLEMTCDYDPTWSYVFVTSPKGSVEFTLPDTLPTGIVDIEVNVVDPATGNWLSSDETSVMVNNRLSAWDRSVGGMSAIDFLILLLLIVMIIVLIVMPFVKGRQPKPAEPPAPPEPPKP